jgi:hypothetical protein
MRCCEQKYGGQEQVTITRNDGKKYAALEQMKPNNTRKKVLKR